MIDPVQLVLLIVVVLLALIMIVLGIQVFFILREVRATLRRLNKLLDTAENLTDTLAHPMSLISGILAGTKSLSPILRLFTGRNSDENRR